MFFVCVFALGLSLGRYWLWPALSVFAAILVIALAIEGAVHDTPFGTVALTTILVLAILETAFLAGTLTRGLRLRSRLYRKV